MVLVVAIISHLKSSRLGALTLSSTWLSLRWFQLVVVWIHEKKLSKFYNCSVFDVNRALGKVWSSGLLT